MAKIENGFHKLADAEYFALDRLSNSGMSSLERSPAHYKWDKENPVDRPSYAFGRAFHCQALEPDLWHNGFAVIPKFDRRTKDGKAEYEAFTTGAAGKTIISEDEYDQILLMMLEYRNNSVVQKIMKSGRPEMSALWEIGSDNGIVECKAKFDWYSNSGIIADVKTTDDASQFPWTVRKYGYDRQAAFYFDAAMALGLEPKGFVFIAVEKKPPYGVATYYMENSLLEQGRQRYLPLVLKYAQCVKENHWPSYPQELIALEGK